MSRGVCDLERPSSVCCGMTDPASGAVTKDAVYTHVYMLSEYNRVHDMPLISNR